MAGARIRKREADSQAEPSRGGVDADETLGVIDPGDRRERGARVDPMESPRAVRRQTRQPEREKSSGRHNSLLVPPLEPHRARRVVQPAVALWPRSLSAMLESRSTGRPEGRPFLTGLSTAPAERALTSRAMQANGPGRSRPPAAGLLALGAAAISKRVVAAVDSASAWP